MKKHILLFTFLFIAAISFAQTAGERYDDFPLGTSVYDNASRENSWGDIASQVHRYDPDGVDVLYVHDPATFAALQAMASSGGGPYIVQNNTPTQGAVTVNDTSSGESFIIPATGFNTSFTRAGNIITITDGLSSLDLDLSFLQYDDTELRDSITVHRAELDLLANAEENVQADYAETDNTADSFIQNKPTWKRQEFFLLAGQTTFTVTDIPDDDAGVFLFLNGQAQSQLNWTRTGNTFTFTSHIGKATDHIIYQTFN